MDRPAAAREATTALMKPGKVFSGMSPRQPRCPCRSKGVWAVTIGVVRMVASRMMHRRQMFLNGRKVLCVTKIRN